MILVHGRGSAADGILAIRPSSAPTVSPFSPRGGRAILVSVHLPGAARPQRARTVVGPPRPDELVTELGARGIPPARVVIGGFSQGACLSLEFAARHPRRYAGIVAFSGGLIGPPGTPRDYPGTLDGTPVFIGCSDIDTHVPVERVRESAEVFRGMGAAVDERIYPGMGHTINQDELQAVSALLAPASGTTA